MVIGFDGSRAFVTGRTGTENYSYQLLKALAKIDRRNTYMVYLRSSVILNKSSVILNKVKDLPRDASKKLAPLWCMRDSNELRDSSLIAQNDKKNHQDDKEGWPENFQFKVINWPRLWTQAGLAIQTFKDNLNVLFVPAHTLPVIRRPGLKTVITVHDLGSEYLPYTHQFKQRLYLGLMQKFQLKTATKIIAVSEATKLDLINKIGIEEKKIKVVYEGYDKELFQPCHSGKSQRDASRILAEGILGSKTRQNDILRDALKQFDLEPYNYFLFVGTVQPRKNLERLIKAFSKYLKAFDDGKWKIEDGTLKMEDGKIDNLSSTINPQNATFHFLPSTVKLVIAGSRGWLSEGIYQLPKKLGIEDKVKFLGYVPEDDLPALYSGALALTFPSLFEGFGLPILEAQACGCPVLTSNTSSMPEVAGKGTVYVNPYDVDDIVKGMKRIQNLEFRVQNVKAGLENVKRFSWEKCAAQTLKVFENL